MAKNILEFVRTRYRKVEKTSGSYYLIRDGADCRITEVSLREIFSSVTYSPPETITITGDYTVPDTIANDSVIRVIGDADAVITFSDALRKGLSLVVINQGTATTTLTGTTMNPPTFGTNIIEAQQAYAQVICVGVGEFDIVGVTAPA